MKQLLLFCLIIFSSFSQAQEITLTVTGKKKKLDWQTDTHKATVKATAIRYFKIDPEGGASSTVIAKKGSYKLSLQLHLAVNRDDHWGLFSLSGALLVPLEYDSIQLFCFGKATDQTYAYLLFKDGAFGIANREGTILVKEGLRFLEGAHTWKLSEEGGQEYALAATSVADTVWPSKSYMRYEYAHPPGSPEFDMFDLVEKELIPEFPQYRISTGDQVLLPLNPEPSPQVVFGDFYFPKFFREAGNVPYYHWIAYSDWELSTYYYLSLGVNNLVPFIAQRDPGGWTLIASQLPRNKPLRYRNLEFISPLRMEHQLPADSGWLLARNPGVDHLYRLPDFTQVVLPFNQLFPELKWLNGSDQYIPAWNRIAGTFIDLDRPDNRPTLTGEWIVKDVNQPFAKCGRFDIRSGIVKPLPGIDSLYPLRWNSGHTVFYSPLYSKGEWVLGFQAGKVGFYDTYKGHLRQAGYDSICFLYDAGPSIFGLAWKNNASYLINQMDYKRPLPAHGTAIPLYADTRSRQLMRSGPEWFLYAYPVETNKQLIRFHVMDKDGELLLTDPLDSVTLLLWDASRLMQIRGHHSLLNAFTSGYYYNEEQGRLLPKQEQLLSYANTGYLIACFKGKWGVLNRQGWVVPPVYDRIEVKPKSAEELEFSLYGQKGLLVKTLACKAP